MTDRLFQGDRGGYTYDTITDYVRLNKQHARVYRIMQDGAWHDLREVSAKTGDPEASVSARLRDFRKERFGSHTVERKHIHGGRWLYRLIWNEAVPRPVFPKPE